MNKLLFAFLLLLTTAVPSFAQTRSIIQKAYAYVQIILPGTMMADDNGQPVTPPLNISRFIYVETKGKTKPVIEYVKYANECFKVEISTFSTMQDEGGYNFQRNKQIMPRPASGNSLWRLDLLSAEEKQIKKKSSPYKNIIIRETKNGKHFDFKIYNEIELASPLTM